MNPTVPSYLTFKCDNRLFGGRCPYCISYENAGTQAEEWLPAKEWIRFYKTLPANYTVDFSGGEPLIYPEWWKLVKRMPRLWSLTTNLNAPMTDWRKLARINMEQRRCVNVTASLHLRDNVDVKEFYGKVKFLHRSLSLLGGVQVNYCAYPRRDYMESLPLFKELFSKIGVRFHVEPFIVSPDKWKYTEEFSDWLQQYYMDDHRTFGWDTDLPEEKVCNAGCNGGYFIATNNGDCYRCNMSFFYTPEETRKKEPFYLGNFADGSFKWNGEALPCLKPCSYGNERENCSIYLPGKKEFYFVGRSGFAGYSVEPRQLA